MSENQTSNNETVNTTSANDKSPKQVKPFVPIFHDDLKKPKQPFFSIEMGWGVFAAVLILIATCVYVTKVMLPEMLDWHDGYIIFVKVAEFIR